MAEVPLPRRRPVPRPERVELDAEGEDVGAAFTGRFPHSMEFASPKGNVEDRRSRNPIEEEISGLTAEEAMLNEQLAILKGEKEPPPRAPMPTITPLGRAAGAGDITRPSPEEVARYLQYIDAYNPPERVPLPAPRRPPLGGV